MTKQTIKSLLAQVQAEPAIQGNIWDFFSRLSNYILYVSAIFIAPLLYLLGVFYLFTAGGQTEKITRAKKLFFWTTVGLVIILIAKGLFTHLANIF